MRVLQSCDLRSIAGGPALSSWFTFRGLQLNGVDVVNLSEPPRAGQKLIDSDAKPVFTNSSKFGTLSYIPGLKKLLNGLGDFDLFHIQGVWMLQGKTISHYAVRRHKPYIVTLRGMLYPQAIAHNSMIKKIALRLYQRNILEKAAVVQCTCQEEMIHFRNLGFKTPVAIIPNPIDTAGYEALTIPVKKDFIVGYLGRLHPRKRIERLIYAMHNLRDKLPLESKLLIIGGGDENYTQFLRDEIARLELDNVVMAGWLSGKDKDEAIKSLSVLAVPSDFENFGNIVSEALLRGVPVIASQGMPWETLPSAGCGWWIPNDQQSIDNTILQCSCLTPEERQQMGERGRRMIIENFSVPTLGKKMLELYRWVIEGGKQPEFVYK